MPRVTFARGSLLGERHGWRNPPVTLIVPTGTTDLAMDRATMSIDPTGHVRMMAAVQPFLSGAISKKVNLPASATVDDVAAFLYAG